MNLKMNQNSTLGLVKLIIYNILNAMFGDVSTITSTIIKLLENDHGRLGFETN